MKKTLRILAIVMALALLGGALASAESAATWSNGQSPQQPYKGVPPVDLTKKLGYMVLDPLNNENVSTAINSLVIYLPRTDVRRATGRSGCMKRASRRRFRRSRSPTARG